MSTAPHRVTEARYTASGVRMEPKPAPAWTLAEVAQLAKSLKQCPACGSYSPATAETCYEAIRTPWGWVTCGYSFGTRQ